MKTKNYEINDSMVPWIGDIPNHWNIIRMKQVCSIVGRIGFRGYTTEDLVDEGEGPITLSPSNIVDNKLTLKKCSYISWEKYEESPEIQISYGDIIIVKTASVGKCAIYNSNDIATINPQLALLKDVKCNKSYLYYLICSDVIQIPIKLSNFGSVVPTITQHDFMGYSIPLLPPSEQTAIAAYLDEKCAAIDEIIAEAKASIEEYKAWKASVIFEAVTKGLDPTAEMKDSGVPWIGKVPKRWGVCKTLFGLSMPITDGPHTTPELYETGVPFISAEAVSCGNGKIDFSHMRGYISEDFYNECCKKYIPRINDIYMIKSGATTGKVAIVDTDKRFTIWSPLAVFRADLKMVVPKYLFYYLQSYAYLKQVEMEWSYGTQQNIGMRVLEQLKICLPPLFEQSAIASYLDDKCAAIDNVIAEKEALIADMELYKKSLIFECVTGKRKVC